MSGNNQQLEYELRQHAYDMLAVNTVSEYENQIGEWQKYINRVVDAEKEAVANHQNVLNVIAAEEKANAEANSMICMFALSLITGPFLSWISGTIQYSIVPKLTGKLKTTVVDSIKLQTPLDKVLFPIGQFTEVTHNKTNAKLYGDFAKERVENIGNGIMSLISSGEKHQIPERAKGNSYLKMTSLANRMSSIDQMLSSLKTTLEEALIDERKMTVSAIIGLATYVKRHLNWGKLVLEKMYKEKPETKKLSGNQLKYAGYKYVEKLVNEDRQRWAKSWTYYGFNPPPSTTFEMSRMIEREIWALWILDQGFKPKGYTYNSNDDLIHEYTRYEGRDKLPFDRVLVNRLVFLNIIEARNMPEMEKSKIQKHLMPNEKFTPASGIDATVDEKKEFESIEKWAIYHPRTTFTKPDNITARTIGSIVDYTK